MATNLVDLNNCFLKQGETLPLVLQSIEDSTVVHNKADLCPQEISTLFLRKYFLSWVLTPFQILINLCNYPCYPYAISGPR
jgi:hypothetical protein